MSQPSLTLPKGVVIKGAVADRYDEVLSHDALAFVAELQRRFNETRKRLLSLRAERQKRFDAGETPDFLSRDEAISARAIGKSRRSRQICRTAASRSPAPSIAR